MIQLQYLSTNWIQIALLGSFIPLLVYFFGFAKRGKQYRYPPGPNRKPLLSEISTVSPPFFSALPFLGNKIFPDPSEKMAEWKKTYGDTILVHLGKRQMVVMHDVETVKKAFSDEAATGRDQDHLLNVLSKGRGKPLP